MVNLFVYRHVCGETLTEMFTLSNRHEAEELGEFLEGEEIIDWYSVSRVEDSWYIGTYLKEKWGL